MSTTRKTTSPARREYCVYATQVVYQHVEAAGAHAAFRKAKKHPEGFEPCGPDLTFDRAVRDVGAHEYVAVGGGPSRCKTCGSDIVATVNDSHFAEGECGPCEYRRYATQAELVALASEFRQECSDRIRQYRDDLKEDFGDPDDLRERVRYWRRHRNRCDAAIARANG